MINPFKFKKRARERAAWLQNTSRAQVYQQLTDLYLKGHFDDGPVFNAAELNRLRQRFDELSLEHKNSRGWDEKAATAILQEHKGQISSNLEVEGALLCTIFAYHAAYPFESDYPAKLDFDAVLRALALLSAKGMRGGLRQGREIVIRRRSESNRRRALFRSLAVPVYGMDTQMQTEDQDATAGKFGTLAIEDDNEEDLLDVLASVQPRASACAAGLTRQPLRPAAQRLSERRHDIESLCIPVEKMCSLLKLLVICRFYGSPATGSARIDFSSGIDQAVQRMLPSFMFNSRGGVPWKTFDSVFGYIMPFLLTGLANLQHSLIAEQAGILRWPSSKPQSSRIFHEVFFQLLTFLPKHTHQKLCQIQDVYSIEPVSSSPAELASLVDSVHQRHGPLIVLISGVFRSQENAVEGKPPAYTASEAIEKTLLIFGLFLPAPSSPEVLGNRGSEDITRLFKPNQLFQLAPLQDLFPNRSTSEKLPWQSFRDAYVTEDGALCFGKPGVVTQKTDRSSGDCGVSLRLDEKLQIGTFVHGVGGKGMYGSSAALGVERGDVKIEFEVQSIELVSL
ncbi:MAG: hypothetical protein L6R35_001338 [Caloplaca aegaea]|nr:MAG: hypothetical protein L6R35_001338 [Caloplaca aegaea]